MLKLYHCHGARSFRPLWTLEEMGLPYDLELIPFPPRLLVENYLDINPLGTVPTLIDDGRLMTESSGMCHYLATRYGPSSLAVEPHEPDYDRYINFLFQSDATLTFPLTIVLRYTRLEPEERRLQQAVDDYAQWFMSRLKNTARALLGDRDYVAADRFTAADIAFTYALRFATTLGVGPFPDNVLRYFEGMQARAGYQRALSAETA